MFRALAFRRGGIAIEQSDFKPNVSILYKFTGNSTMGTADGITAACFTSWCFWSHMLGLFNSPEKKKQETV